jgi:phage head maturation protease
MIPGRITGLACPYGEWRDPDLTISRHGGVQTRFAAGAFAEAVRQQGHTRPSPYLTVDDYDHGQGADQMRLATCEAGTLLFWEDARGLWFEAQLPEHHRGVYVWELVRAGFIRHCCLGYAPAPPPAAAGDAFEVHHVPQILGLKLLLFQDPCFPVTSVAPGGGRLVMPLQPVASQRP